MTGSVGKFNLTRDSGEDNTFNFSDISLYTKFVITGFDLLNINAFEPYYSKSNYDFTTTNDIYGIRTIIDSFTIEAGYRHFKSNYDDSFFIVGAYKSPDSFFLSMSFDNYHKKLGIGFHESDFGTYLLELVLNQENTISVSLSAKISQFF
jgi:hypothetical protein